MNPDTQAKSAGRAQAAPANSDTGLTFRSGALALGAVVLLACFMPAWALWMKGPDMPGGYMPLIAFAMVILLLGLRWLPPRFRFSGREILTVFCILAVALSAFGAVGGVIALLPTPYYFATPENDYRGHFLTEIPAFLVPFDPADEGQVSDPILRFYRGASDVPWEVWIEPLMWWFALLALVFFAQLCLSVVVQRQWMQHEKLMFPHVTMVASLLEEASEDRPPVLKDRLFWTGAGVSGFVYLLEGLNRYAPDVPAFGLAGLSMRDFLVDVPWNEMDPALSVHLYTVGIAYLLTTEISFSIWFFAVLDNLLHAVASALALPQPVKTAWGAMGSIHWGADTVGAVALFTGALVWRGRRHFRGVVERAFGRQTETDDREELMGYRAAFWGFCAAAAGILAWCAAAGIPIWFAALIFGIYALSVVFISRLVAETGLITASAPWRPQMLAVQICGYKAGSLSAAAAGAAKPVLLKAMGVLSFVWPTLMLGPHLMPLALTGGKAVEAPDRRRRWILPLSFAGLLLAMAVFAWRMLTEIYARGALNAELHWFGESIWVFNNMLVRDVILREQAWTTNWTEMGFIGVGAVAMAFLLYMRRTFYWWPLHPIGYIALGIGRGLWFSVLVGWFIKSTVLKYGGGDAFKRLIGFFIGLFVGQFVLAAVWYIVGFALGEAEVHILNPRG